MTRKLQKERLGKLYPMILGVQIYPSTLHSKIMLTTIWVEAISHCDLVPLSLASTLKCAHKDSPPQVASSASPEAVALTPGNNGNKELLNGEGFTKLCHSSQIANSSAKVGEDENPASIEAANAS